MCYHLLRMWDNASWAARHIKKHDITVEEAWGVYRSGAKFLVSPDQLHYPPFLRYWAIGKTQTGRLLFVAWEQHKETRNLITSYEPSERLVTIYEKKSKTRIR